jgi:hypothetical protein
MLLYIHSDLNGNPIYDILSVCDSVNKCHELISFHLKYNNVYKYQKVTDYNQIAIYPAFSEMTESNNYTLLSSRLILSTSKYNSYQGTGYLIEKLMINQLIE